MKKVFLVILAIAATIGAIVVGKKHCPCCKKKEEEEK